MALGRDVHMFDIAMNIMIASGLIIKSCLSSSCKSSDFVLHATEKAKFGKDGRSMNPMSSSSTMCFAPLALNHFGLRGPHFQAVLMEFATIPVTNKAGGMLTPTRAFCSHTPLSSTQDSNDVGFSSIVDISEGAR